MSKILIPPEVLLAVSDQFDRASDQLEANKNTLNQQIQMLASCVEDKAKVIVSRRNRNVRCFYILYTRIYYVRVFVMNEEIMSRHYDMYCYIQN